MLTIPNQAQDLEAKTVRELQKLAAELQIRGRSKLRKTDLIEAILESARRVESGAPESDMSGVAVDVTEAVESRALEALEELPEILILDDSFEATEENTEDNTEDNENLESSSSFEEEIAMACQDNEPSVAFGPSEITLLGVHSRRLFAYWQCDPGAVGSARLALNDPDATITLRFSDVTLIEFDSERELSSVDISVHSPAGNYYFNDVPPGHSFRCKVGIKGQTGKFRELVRSETVATPQEFMTTVESVNMASVAGAGDGPWKPRSSEPVPRPRRAASSKPDSEQKNVPVADAAVEIRRDRVAPVSPPAADVAPPPGESDTPPFASAAAVSNGGPVFKAEVRPRFNFSPPDVAHQASSLDLAESGTESSLGLAAPSSRLGGESSLGLIPLVERVPEPELSDAVTMNPDQPGLELELHAELIVYGRASPEIQVVIDGVRVPVRDDGRFDVRFALNHVPTERP
jgi:hypothetical protein